MKKLCDDAFEVLELLEDTVSHYVMKKNLVDSRFIPL